MKFLLKLFNNKKNEIMFFCGLLLVVCSELFDIMYCSNILSGGIGYRLGIILLFIKIVFDKEFFLQNHINLIIQVILLIIGAVTYITTNQTEMLAISLIIVASRKINYSSIIIFYFYLISVVYLTNIILIVTSIKKTELFYIAAPGHRDYANTLGFMYPNNAILIFLCIYLYYILLNKSKIDLLNHIFFLLSGTTLFFLTDGRMPFYTMIMTFMLLVFFQTKLCILYRNNVFSVITIILCTSVMVILGIVFNGNRLVISNFGDTFISRIMAWGITIHQVGIHPFGMKFDAIVPLDSVYYYILFRYGYISLLVFIFEYIIAIIKNSDDQYYGIVCMMIFVIALIDKKVIQSYFLLPLIGLVADRSSCILEDVVSYEKIKSINYAVIGGIVVLLIGHGIYQNLRENHGFITIVNVVRITDILFIIIGFTLGMFIHSFIQKTKNKIFN